MPSSHSLDRLHTSFDEPHLIAHAGLLLPATLAQHPGLPDLFTNHVDLGRSAGHAQVGRKAMTLIASLLAGGDCIDDAAVLRAAGSAAVLGHAIPAPSTLGTFLRAFSWGHAKQLDVVNGLALQRAWAAGAGPGDGPLTLDLDSTVCETYGLQKQGGSRFTYTHVRGYHPLVATRAGAGASPREVLHSRLRGGPANSGRGAANFLAETFVRVRRAGARGSLVMRGDSGFCHQKVVATCRRSGARFSITVRLTRNLWRVIGEIPEPAWTPIPYWLEGAAEVAEVDYVPFAARRRPGQPATKPVRLIVRRVQPTSGSQLQLQGVLRFVAGLADRSQPGPRPVLDPWSAHVHAASRGRHTGSREPPAGRRDAAIGRLPELIAFQERLLAETDRREPARGASARRPRPCGGIWSGCGPGWSSGMAG